MGWSSGSTLLSDIIETLKAHVDDEVRRIIYPDIVEAFEECDCDTIDECEGIDPVFDEYLKEHVFDEEDDED